MKTEKEIREPLICLNCGREMIPKVSWNPFRKCGVCGSGRLAKKPKFTPLPYEELSPLGKRVRNEMMSSSQMGLERR